MEVAQVSNNNIPGKDAIFGNSEEMPEDSVKVKGYDFSNGLDYHELLKSYACSGLQATNFGLAVDEINKMLEMRQKPLLADEIDSSEEDIFIRRKTKCTIFLGYTSNMISSGIRETILFLIKNKMVDCIVSSAGGIEEDFIKCFSPTYIGSFGLKGKDLRSKKLNRIGNMIVPNSNYCKFEEWLLPILDSMLEEQKTKVRELCFLFTINFVEQFLNNFN
ncbi:DHPS (predicted) [Pycnogonum litorale]